MIQRVYICTNLNSPFVVQSNDQLEDSKINTVVMPNSSHFAFGTQVESKERDHMFLLVLIFCRIVLAKIVCISIEQTTCL